MRPLIVTRGLPMLLVLMGVAVILIIGGSGNLGLTFGLVVAGTAGVLLVSMVLYEVTNGNGRDRPRQDRVYRPQARGF
jgi:hypothetical protein